MRPSYIEGTSYKFILVIKVYLLAMRELCIQGTHYEFQTSLIY